MQDTSPLAALGAWGGFWVQPLPAVVRSGAIEGMNVRKSTSLDRLDHVAIAVGSVADAVRWYRAHFRCEVAYEDATWALLRFANTQLALVVPEQHPPHIGFVSEHAEKYGDTTPHRDGTQSVYSLDPAGNAVEVLRPYRHSGGSDA